MTRPETYVKETNPALIRYALANQGLAFEPPDDFVCCHIGPATDLVPTMLAAAYPEARFFAVGLDGLPAMESPPAAQIFEGLTRLPGPLGAIRNDLPDCDLMIVHAGGCQFDKDEPDALLPFIDGKLKAHGALYIDYDCLPGSAPLQSLAHLFQIYSEVGTSERGGLKLPGFFVNVRKDEGAVSSVRIEPFLELVENVLAAESPFVRANKSFIARIKHLRETEPGHYAHRLLTHGSDPVWGSDVSAALHRRGIHFGGPARLLDQVDRLALPGGLGKTLGPRINPILREAVRDVLVNRGVRHDLFVRGPKPLSNAARVEFLAGSSFILLAPVEAFPYRFIGPFGAVELHKAQYGPLLEVLAEDGYRPKRVIDILAKPAFGRVSRGGLLRMLTILTGVGFAHPVRSETTIEAARPTCARFNTANCLNAKRPDANGRSLQAAVLLISPVTGGALQVPLLQCLFLLAGAGQRDDPAHWAHFAESVLADGGFELKRRDQDEPIKNQTAIPLSETANRFRQGGLAILSALGIAPLAWSEPG